MINNLYNLTYVFLLNPRQYNILILMKTGIFLRSVVGDTFIQCKTLQKELKMLDYSTYAFIATNSFMEFIDRIVNS